ncbi:hypothetical protein [Eubacterium aggregans]|uniref:hypothetical protein n=1 Tax=Eubacterium aggregans TaxID=81409 RepID=UPI003F3C50C7
MLIYFCSEETKNDLNFLEKDLGQTNKKAEGLFSFYQFLMTDVYKYNSLQYIVIDLFVVNEPPDQLLQAAMRVNEFVECEVIFYNSGQIEQNHVRGLLKALKEQGFAICRKNELRPILSKIVIKAIPESQEKNLDKEITLDIEQEHDGVPEEIILKIKEAKELIDQQNRKSG